MRVFVDTNVLLNEHFDLTKYEKIYISIVSIEELDGLKSSERIGYQARKAIKNIESANNIEIKMNCGYSGANKFLEHKNDNIILSMAFETYIADNEVLFLSDDYNLIIKARALNLPCQMFEYDKSEIEIYNGIRKISLTDYEYNNIFLNITDNLYGLYSNEYLIVNDLTTNEEHLLTWNGQYIEEVKIKPISNKYLNKINPLDIYQKAFIHMLQNENVKIKITDSKYGVGKTFLMIHWALQMIDKDKYDKLYFVKSDSPPKGRREFPELPGDINEKCEPLMGVLCDTVSENNLTEILLRNNKLEILPIQFCKGRSLKNSILMINECQDFTPSEIEKLVSRAGENTVVLLDGSTCQIDNKNCLHRNGLTVASNNFKNSGISAQVNMINDYRSDISREISKMDWHD